MPNLDKIRKVAQLEGHQVKKGAEFTIGQVCSVTDSGNLEWHLKVGTVIKIVAVESESGYFIIKVYDKKKISVPFYQIEYILVENVE